MKNAKKRVKFDFYGLKTVFNAGFMSNMYAQREKTIFFSKKCKNPIKSDFICQRGYHLVVPPGGGGTTLLRNPGQKR